jgi:hypothetical protein
VKSVLKLLVDENLSPTLVQLANERGFVCSHVSYLGFAGDKDWELRDKILDGDWTFITANSPDFRGPRDAPGSKGEYADIVLHAGLICINAPGGTNRAVQHAVMKEILDVLEEIGDLTNQVLEADLSREAELTFRRYELPKLD